MAEYKKESIEFLLKELDNIYALWRRTRDLGITKLQYQFTVASALLGFLGFLMQCNTIPPQQLVYYFIAVFLLLTLINWQTFDYMVSRLTTSESYTRALSRIRRFFIDNDPTLGKYVSFKTDDSPSTFLKLKTKGVLWVSRVIFCFSIAGLCASIIFLLLNSMLYLNIIFLLSTLTSYYLTHKYINKKIEKYLSNQEEDIRFDKMKNN